MHCDDAGRLIHAGQTSPDLDVHCSACDDCRLLAEDVAQIGAAFARARAEWAPSASFRVRLPAAPWRRLAIAASLLVLPLAGWAALSLRASEPSLDVASLLDPRPSAPVSDRQLLGSFFLEEVP